MRDEFLLDPDIVFLNHGSFGACPRKVFAVYQDWQRELERNPVEFLGRRSADLLLTARQRLAGYLGARADDLVFLTNATCGVNTVARSLHWPEGSEILTTDHEYGACDNTWRYVCGKTGARYIPVEIPIPFRAGEFADRIWAAVTPRTRMIYLSHLTSTTALVFPAAEICRRARERNILTLIDGAHGPGQMELNLDQTGADFYAGNCHKWLCAPKGAAFLHVRPEHQHLLDAPVISWGYSTEISGHTGFTAYTGNTLFERHLQWQGTRDLAAFLSVPAAIDFQEKHHWNDIRQQCHTRLVELKRRLEASTGLPPLAGENDFIQMAALPVPATDPDWLKDSLFNRYRIEVPVTTHAGQVFVRPSFQAYNRQEDAEALLAALQEIYKISIPPAGRLPGPR